MNPREIIDEPGIDSSKHKLTALGARLYFGMLSEEPCELCAGEIWIEHKACFLPNQIGSTLRFQFVAYRARAAALPNNRIMDRLACCALPYNGSFALIRNAYCGNLCRFDLCCLDRASCCL